MDSKLRTPALSDVAGSLAILLCTARQASATAQYSRCTVRQDSWCLVSEAHKFFLSKVRSWREMRGWGSWHAQDPDGFVENGGWDFLDAEGGDDDEEGEDSEEEGAFLRKISIIVGRPSRLTLSFFGPLQLWPSLQQRCHSQCRLRLEFTLVLN